MLFVFFCIFHLHFRMEISVYAAKSDVGKPLDFTVEGESKNFQRCNAYYIFIATLLLLYVIYQDGESNFNEYEN